MELREFLCVRTRGARRVTGCQTLGLEVGPPPWGFLQVLLMKDLKWSGINSCGSVDSEGVGRRRHLWSGNL